MLKPRYGHSSILLEGGNVLIAGGSCGAEGFLGTTTEGACAPELYDPSKGTFSIADPAGTHHEEDAIKLVDGKVFLFCGGTIAEVYDPKSGKFARTGDAPQRMDFCGSTLLHDGRVLVFGNLQINTSKKESPAWRVQIFDPVSGSFAWLQNPQLDINAPVLVSIEGNRALISGEVNPDYDNVLSSEIFDGSKNEFSVLGAQHPLRKGLTATELMDGTILLAGGSSIALPYNVRRAALFCP